MVGGGEAAQKQKHGSDLFGWGRTVKPVLCVEGREMGAGWALATHIILLGRIPAFHGPSIWQK